MNGHSTAEILAFSLLEAQRELRGEIRGSDDRPIFLFTAGWDTGARELRQRLGRAASIALGQSVDASLLDAFARQLLHFANEENRRTPCDGPGTAVQESTGRVHLRSIAEAQAKFLRALAVRESGESDKWGMELVGVPGDYALYLRLLFPGAKIVFLHRDPLEAFKRSVEAARLEEKVPNRDLRWARSFAEGWCATVSSFELWHSEAGALMASYDQVIKDPATGLEEYLGERLTPLSDEAIDTFEHGRLRDEEVKLIVERTADIASRQGYATARSAAAPSLTQGTESPAMPAASAVEDGAQSRCAILVPTMRYIEPDCDAALRELERRGYVVRRLHGCSAIDAARNRLATWALDEGFGETLWVDADTGFDPEVVERLRSHQLPVVAALCAKKNPLGGLAVAGLPGTREVVMGDAGGIAEILYAGMGFTLVRREVYLAIQHRFELPTCSPTTPRRSIPFFMPMLEHWGGEMSYLAEDYAFSRRARLCGYKIMADTSIRLWHIGTYRYGYEDAGNAVERVPTYRHVFEPEDRRGG